MQSTRINEHYWPATADVCSTTRATSTSPRMFTETCLSTTMHTRHLVTPIISTVHILMSVHETCLSPINWLIEQGSTSPPTQYRLYGRRFLADRTNSRTYATVLHLSVIVCLSVTLCIVAKWCVIEQKLLFRAYRKSYMRNRLAPKWMTLTFV